MSDTTETETDTNTDNTDEPTKAELHDRVQQLESTVEKLMPSRRDALRMGAAGLAGAAGLGAASQPAEASTGSAGTIGSTSDRPDLIADDVGPRSIADDYLYAGEFSGGDPDARLDNCLSAATNGTTIYLENATYTDDRTIGTKLTITGTASTFSLGTFLDSLVWTINSPTRITHVGAGGPGDVTFDIFANGCIISHINHNTLTVNFGSNTEGGIVNMIATTLPVSATVNDPSGNNIIGNEIH